MTLYHYVINPPVSAAVSYFMFLHKKADWSNLNWKSKTDCSWSK